MSRLHLGAVVCLVVSFSAVLPAAEPFQLKPSVAIEAEDFTVEKGWKVIEFGKGNYMVDIIGFNHTSGERVLGVDAKDTTAVANKDITVPVDGDYRLWVRYEYPPFTETRFHVAIAQGGKVIAEKAMGAKDNPRLAFGDTNFKPQYDPSWGSEGLVEELLEVKGLKAGAARITLKPLEQPQVPGVAANRNIDLVFLTSDVADTWRPYYAAGWGGGLYPILNAFREAMGPRWEVQFINKGTKPANAVISHVYNRSPWAARETANPDVAAGAASAWIPLINQDTCHFGMSQFDSSTKEPFDLVLRPAGGQPARTFNSPGNPVRVYLPPYANKPEKPVTPQEEIDVTLKLLAANPAPGKKPALPLAHGGWINVGSDDDYGRKYAELYAAIGMRSFACPLLGDFNVAVKNLKPFGVELNRSMAAMGYRNPPTDENIKAAKEKFTKDGLIQHLQYFDYGDEMAFGEWVGYMAADAIAKAPDPKPTQEVVVAQLWRAWLAKNRPGFKADDYWMADWGAVDAAKLKPNSTAQAAAAKPRLYVDSLIFYEDAAIEYTAAAAKKARAELGDYILCGANYGCHPFYYPDLARYVKWFRGNAAELGRHSEYFWQVGQPGPMCNGYIAEHFRSGMRFNPRAVLRQYTMPHSPGNVESSFMRTAFTHFAHGARMVDYFGIGMDEGFTENHIDHKDHDRYRLIRDVNYSIGLVEDILLESTVLPSKVAMLISDSTERWDNSGVATEFAGLNQFGAPFRKERLAYHQDRLGMWHALTFLGAAPDLIIEADLKPDFLKDYQVLYVVGDSLPAEAATVLEKWVADGGILMATAGAGRFETYHAANPAMEKVLGIAARKTEEKDTFFRPRMELPFLKQYGTVVGAGWEMPQLAFVEDVTPAEGAEILAKFKDGEKPAVFVRTLGKGRVFYVAALPGVAYMWTALQPPSVPDRSPGVHVVPVDFDKGADAIISMPLGAAKFEPVVKSDVKLVDTRLIQSSKAYILPIANYNREVGQDVTLSIRAEKKIKKATSSFRGELPVKEENGRYIITIPKLGYGDMLRLDV